MLTGPLYWPLIALFRDALALGLVPAHHDRLHGLTADPAMLLVPEGRLAALGSLAARF